MIDQEENFAVCGAIGKAFAPNVGRKEIEDGIMKLCGTRNVGLSLFTARKFQAVMANKQEAQQLLDGGLRVAGKPVRVIRWTPTACQNLDQFDVAIYWVLLPKLPLL